MARQGRFGRSGTTQNLSVLVYQLLKEQMSSEMSNILSSYETNMRAGRYSSQFNGQNVDGEYVMSYMSSMLAGFPPGSTEFETLNSQLASFRERYQKDIQDLAIDSMNNGTQIDFGLLGPAFSNKGIAEVELSDVRNWADSEIATLLENGDTAQADKIKGAVFIAGFNVENDGKVAAVNNESLTRGAYNKWLKGQLGAVLEAGYTKDSEAYRSILKLQAEAASQAKKEGETKAAEGVVGKINDVKSGLNAKAQALLQKYAATDGTFIDDINAIIGKTTSAFPYYEAMQQLAAQIGTESEYSGHYGAIMGADSTLEADYNAAVVAGQTTFTQIRDSGMDGLSDEDRLTIGADLSRDISQGSAYISQSGIPFSSGGGAAALDSLYTGLSGAGVYFRNEGGVKNGMGGHPEAVFDVMKNFGKGMADSKVEGYSLLKSLSQGNIPVSLVEGFGKDTIKDINTDGVISSDEWDAAFKAGLSQDTFAQIEEAAMKKASAQTMPSVDGSPTITAQTLVSVVLGAHRSNYILKNGGQVVMQANGMVSIADMNSPAGALAQPALISIGGKTYGGVSEPMQITQISEGSNVATDWAENTNMQINVYRTGGPGDGNKGMYVQITGKFNGPNGAAPNGISLPYNDFKKWMKDVAGVDLNDKSFLQPNSQDPAAILVQSDDKRIAQNINLSDAFANITNPESDYFIGKSNSGKGSGIMQMNESNVRNYEYPGFITDPSNISSAIDSAFKNPKDIMSKATALAAERGGNVTQKDLIRAVYSSIPGIPNTYNIDLQAEKFGQYGNVGARIQNLFPEVKETGQGLDIFSLFKGTGAYPAAIPTSTGPGGSIPTSTKPGPSIPTSTKPGPSIPDMGGGKDDGGPLGFLGNVFRNVPNIFSKNDTKAPVMSTPAPVKPVTAKPTTPIAQNNKPSSIYKSRPGDPGRGV